MNIWRKLFSPKYLNKKNNLFVWLILVFIISFFSALALGSAHVSIKEAVLAVLKSDIQNTDLRIIFYVRLPRVLGAVLAGSALAVSGVVIQAVLNNAMASPNIIGVNAGAGLTAVLAFSLFPSYLYIVPAASFFGALGASLLIFFIASKTGASRMTVTLVGIAVSSILNAAISVVKTIFPDSVYNMTSFSVGGLAGITYENIYYVLPAIIISIVILCFLAYDIDILNLGEETAQSLGMNIRLMRFGLLILASILAGSAVSFAGLISFVGLVVPHIMRKIAGNNHKILIPASALGGAILVLVCDLIGRTLFAPYEIPVGIILSFIGGPFFIALILKRGRKIYD